MSALTNASKSVAVVAYIAAFFTSAIVSFGANAQQVTRIPVTTKPAAIDSVAKIVAADTSDDADDDDGRAHGVRHTVSVQPFARSYKVGAQSVSEQSAGFTWRLTSEHVGARISATSTKLTANPYSVSGVTPVRARFDFMLRPGDTISVYGRSASSPLSLSAEQTSALSAIGTSTIDLESTALGVTSQFGARGIASFPVGDVVLGLIGSVEFEPRPTTTTPVYWRGNTVRGGLSLSALAGEADIVATSQVAFSSGDSLGGRNLFPGGGDWSTDFSIDTPIGSEGTIIGTASAFYTHPFNNKRSDQPTRLIPDGDFYGITGALVVPVKDWTLSPLLTVSRETSQAEAVDGLVKSALHASGWSLAGSMSLDIPLAGRFTVSPEGGAVVGNVSAHTSASLTRPRLRGGRTLNAGGFSDRVSGFWAGLGFALSF
ncbi:MAG: hypothetical protein ABJB66_00490 [Gemmatimonadaceae bacterium]